MKAILLKILGGEGGGQIIWYARVSCALLLAAVSAGTMVRQAGLYPVGIGPLEWWLRCGGETAVAFVLLAMPFPAAVASLPIQMPIQNPPNCTRKSAQNGRVTTET